MSVIDLASIRYRQLLNRQQLLLPIDELFLVLVRLPLNLLEKDLEHRFNCSTLHDPPPAVHEHVA